MPCEFKNYYKYVNKDNIDTKIEEAEDEVLMYKNKLLALSSMTPYAKEECEGHKVYPEEWIPFEIEEIFRELEEINYKLVVLRIIKSNEEYSSEDNDWSDY